MKRTSGLIGVTLAIAGAMASAQERIEVSTVYEAGHFYATPTLADGERLRLLVDTGGGGGAGWFLLFSSTVKRIGLHTAPCTSFGETLDTVAQLTYRDGQALPAQNTTPCPGPALSMPLDATDGEDGILGAGYLPGHVWTFDYPAQKLWLEPANWQASASMHRVPLGVSRNAKGEPNGGYLRIPVRVEQESIDLLLDTGATAKPTATGKLAGAAVTASGFGVTSYITTSQLERWHHAHPTWRIIANGDGVVALKGGTRLIEVPRLIVGEWVVGPVWFTERPDGNFDEATRGMSMYTDQPVVGALGANVFRDFTMTLDYPTATAWFACASGCTATKAH